MQLLKVSDLIVNPNRQRQEFEKKALSELSSTIQARGLMHAIVCRETPEGLVLVAGERRLRAITDLWMLGGKLKYDGKIIPDDHIPYVTLGQLSPLQAEEAELEENLHRKDLTWQENSAAMAKLHRIRSIQAQAEGRIHTVADTAMETKGRSDGSYQEAVRKDIIVAKHLDNPEVARAKTAEEAFRVLKRQEATQKSIQLGEQIGKSFTSSIHELHKGDCLEWMAACQPGQFDVILTDPPFGDPGMPSANGEKADLDSWRALMTRWCPLSYRVAKREAHAYVFCDLDNFPELRLLMKGAGWYVFRTPFICTKPNTGRVPLPDEGPRRQYETLLYAIKGHKKTTAIYSDVITTYADAGVTQGTQKSVSLYENLLQRSVRPGDTVLDSFAGSGTVFPSAHTFKCKAVGLENSGEYYGVSLERLRGLSEPTPAETAGGKSLANELLAMLGK